MQCVRVCVCVGHPFGCVVKQESRDKSGNTQQNEELERQYVTSEKTKGSMFTKKGKVFSPFLYIIFQHFSNLDVLFLLHVYQLHPLRHELTYAHIQIFEHIHTMAVCDRWFKLLRLFLDQLVSFQTVYTCGLVCDFICSFLTFLSLKGDLSRNY